MNALEKVPGLSEVAVFGGGLHVTVADATRAVPRNAIRARTRRHLGPDDLEPIQPSMEDVFVAMIEEEERKVA